MMLVPTSFHGLAPPRQNRFQSPETEGINRDSRTYLTTIFVNDWSFVFLGRLTEKQTLEYIGLEIVVTNIYCLLITVGRAAQGSWGNAGLIGVALGRRVLRPVGTCFVVAVVTPQFSLVKLYARRAALTFCIPKKTSCTFVLCPIGNKEKKSLRKHLWTTNCVHH